MTEKRRRWNRRKLAVLVAVAMCFAVPGISLAASGDDIRPWRTQLDTSYRGWMTIDNDDIVAKATPADMTVREGEPDISEETVLMQPGDSVDIKIAVPKAGEYSVVLEYKVTDGRMLDSAVEVTAAEQKVHTTVYGLWQDKSKDYSTDRYGNEERRSRFCWMNMSKIMSETPNP